MAMLERSLWIIGLSLMMAPGCGDDSAESDDTTGETTTEGGTTTDDVTTTDDTTGGMATTDEPVDDSTGDEEQTDTGVDLTESDSSGGEPTGTGGSEFIACEASVAGTLRVASFNGSLSFFGGGVTGLADALRKDGRNAPQVAEVIQTVCPDVLLLNEFDYDENGEAADLFQERFLEQPQGDGEQVAIYPHRFVAPANTGVMPETPQDFDNDGEAGQGGNDAFGFGNHPGEFAFVVFSKYPVLTDEIRCFQNFLWRDMPGALLPVDPETGDSWYSEEELDVFRLSSKNHCDIPIQVGDEVLHVLASHPTPPVFDGEEDRNGTRNHDEIRLWRDYVSENPEDAAYLVDDNGTAGGAVADEPFVIMGDLNADPFDGDRTGNPIADLLAAARVNDRVTPLSQGGIEAAALDGADNDAHEGNPGFDTADFSEPPGNLRADYALPSSEITASGVFWPLSTDPQSEVADIASDHRMVWVDLDLTVGPPRTQRFTDVELDGRSETIRSEETNLGNLIADSMLWEGLRSYEAAGAPEPVLALQNGGGIRNGDLIPVGELPEALFEDILPFDNELTVVHEVVAADLVRLLEVAVASLPEDDFNGPFAQVSGLRFTWDPSLEPDSRVTELTVLTDPPVVVVTGGVVDGDAGPFTIVTNSFVAGGGDGWPLGGYDSTDVADGQRQGFINYVDSFPNRTVPAEAYPLSGDGRITEVTAEE